MGTHFGEWLKGQIAAIPMGQAEFARANDIPKPTLTRWIASRCPPIRPANVVRLGKGLGVDADVIYLKLRESHTGRSIGDELVEWVESLDENGLRTLMDQIRKHFDPAEVARLDAFIAAAEEQRSKSALTPSAEELMHGKKKDQKRANLE